LVLVKQASGGLARSIHGIALTPKALFTGPMLQFGFKVGFPRRRRQAFCIV
jgi:hypothetical protein